MINAKVKNITKERRIVILHTNDVHANVFETRNSSLGYAKIKSIVDEYKKRNKVILLDAGDTIHGQPIASMTKGESIIKILNTLKYDAMTLGNHDFSYGRERLNDIRKMAKFPLIAANIVDEFGKRPFKSYTIKKINGVRVGIFGLATPETPDKARLSDVKGLSFLEPYEISRATVSKLKEKNVDVIIALTHLGLQGDYTSEKLAKKVSGIDIIIDGHSHTTLDNGMIVGDTLITQAGEKAKNLGVIDICIKNHKIDKKKVYLLDSRTTQKIRQNKKVKNIIDKYNKEIKKELSKTVCHIHEKLEGERNDVRTRETNLGNLISDTMRIESLADIAILNGGGIRNSIDKGVVTKEDVYKVLPFGNKLIVKEISGKELLELLENGVSKYPQEYGGFPQLSGAKVMFNSNCVPKNRIKDVKVRGEQLKLDKKYSIAISSPTSDGGDGYSLLRNKPEIKILEPIEDILIKFMSKKEFKLSKLNNRIMDLKDVKNPPEIKNSIYSST